MHMRKSKSGTLGGGVTSLCLNILILVFFCMRVIDVTKHNDPTISSYIVYEESSKMENPINLGDNGQQLSFGFFN